MAHPSKARGDEIGALMADQWLVLGLLITQTLPQRLSGRDARREQGNVAAPAAR